MPIHKNLVRLALSSGFFGIALAAQAADKLYIQHPAAYDKDAAVVDKVKQECAPEVRVVEFIQEYAKGQFDEIVGVKTLPRTGKTLSLTILNVAGVGGGVWSGKKSITLTGTLKENDKVIGTFHARRSTGGGGFGTCAMLERCAKALGKDIAQWLKQPTIDARLGEM